MQSVQALLDKDAIRDLVLCYSRAVDRQDFALLRTLYAEDATEDDHNGHYAGPASGYVDWLERVMPRLGITSHQVTNHLIGLESETEAQGEVYMIGYHRLPKQGGGWEDLVHGMRYLDHYRKVAGRWLFARRRVTLDWKQVQPCCWDLDDPARQKSPVGRHDAQDPSYRTLSHPIFGRSR